MTTRKQVREAVGTALDGIDGVRGYAYTPVQVNPPAAVVVEVDVDFDETMQRGSDRFTVRVRLLTGGDMRAAQDRLDELASTLKAEMDGNLGGVVDYCRVARIRGDSEGQIDVGGGTYAVVDVDLEVIA